MDFDLEHILDELDNAPVTPIPDYDTALAILDDVLRRAGRPPVSPATWAELCEAAAPRFKEQAQLLARLLTTSSLREQARACLAQRPDRRDQLLDLFAAIAPLTLEMVLSNRFRREEVVRRFIDWCEGRIKDEEPETSARRLTQLDYRTTLAEYQRAEAAREKEEAARLKALEEARRREEASRGWRE